jgi:hypothetical protein
MGLTTQEALIQGQYISKRHQPSMKPTKDQNPIVIANSLGEVEIGIDGVPVNGTQTGAQHRDAVVALDLECDIFGRSREACKIDRSEKPRCV